jgi:hypothetical protein
VLRVTCKSRSFLNRIRSCCLIRREEEDNRSELNGQCELESNLSLLLGSMNEHCLHRHVLN